MNLKNCLDIVEKNKDKSLKTICIEYLGIPNHYLYGYNQVLKAKDWYDMHINPAVQSFIATLVAMDNDLSNCDFKRRYYAMYSNDLLFTIEKKNNGYVMIMNGVEQVNLSLLDVIIPLIEDRDYDYNVEEDILTCEVFDIPIKDFKLDVANEFDIGIILDTIDGILLASYVSNDILDISENQNYLTATVRVERSNMELLIKDKDSSKSTLNIKYIQGKVYSIIVGDTEYNNISVSDLLKEIYIGNDSYYASSLVSNIQIPNLKIHINDSETNVIELLNAVSKIKLEVEEKISKTVTYTIGELYDKNKKII